jgi:hypothetical protein
LATCRPAAHNGQIAKMQFEHIGDSDGHVRLTVEHVQSLPFGFVVTVPAGFVTDGASVPRFCWPFIGPPIRSRYFPAAVVHDFLCVESTTYGERVVADAIFFYLLRRLKIKRWKRGAMYLAVRFWGRYTYQGDRNDDSPSDIQPDT